jgi:hypothetical protein
MPAPCFYSKKAVLTEWATHAQRSFGKMIPFLSVLRDSVVNPIKSHGVRAQAGFNSKMRPYTGHQGSCAPGR